MSHLKKWDFGNSVSAPDWVEQRLSNKQGQTSACQSRKTKGLSVSLTLKSSIQISHPHSSSAYPALTSLPQTQHPPALKPPGWFYLELLCNFYYARRLYRMTVSSPFIFLSVMLSQFLFHHLCSVFLHVCLHIRRSPKNQSGLGKSQNWLPFNL